MFLTNGGVSVIRCGQELQNQGWFSGFGMKSENNQLVGEEGFPLKSRIRCGEPEDVKPSSIGEILGLKAR